MNPAGIAAAGLALVLAGAAATAGAATHAAARTAGKTRCAIRLIGVMNAPIPTMLTLDDRADIVRVVIHDAIGAQVVVNPAESRLSGDWRGCDAGWRRYAAGPRRSRRPRAGRHR